ncbi:hypothetical protein SAMN05661096_01061 [Marivirga sericea]|uniref:Outer membrane protein beta-barrel domain-containing protein n=1 Tax=Marivirga sericea TaxID=1028 RepID=A0A1X7IU11_9BACT|nr:hypothetical protein [Marivirga sericea]SMG18354.1 hypothetical protein SAMN05661096_01061 [Marivirga sericea]
MSKYIVILLFLVGFSAHLHAQSSCERSLNEARADYSNGNLYAVPGKLADCLEDGYTKIEKVEALRLLTLTYININQQEKARETLIKLLNLKTDYQAIRNEDPSELYSLYKKIDTDIKYFFGITFGSNLNTIGVKYRRTTLPFESDQYRYTPKISIPQVGIQFLYPLTKNIIAGAEIQYQNQKYSYTETNDYGGEDVTTITYDSNNEGVNLNLVLRYMQDFYVWKPFIEIGSTVRTNFSYEISNYISDFDPTADEENINETIPVNSDRVIFNFALNANLGTMIKLGENYGEIKFGVSNYFRNHLNEQARSEVYTSTILDGMVLKDDDYTNIVYQITFTFNLPFFNFQ